MAEQALPAKIGRYQVLRLIGEGGMGRVFAARDPQLDRVVAVKLVATGSPGGAQALLAEALVMAKLSHPNVVAVYDAGMEGDEAFVVMELVSGTTLREWQTRWAKSWREVLQAYVEAGLGLAAAHRAGITHRDFKPDNVLIGADGRARVTDFGLARATSARGDSGGALMGTPKYMAPEQLAGGRADPRSDQYAFCAALTEALFGTVPRPSTAYARAGPPTTVPIGPPAPAAAEAPRAATSDPPRVPGYRAVLLRPVLNRGLSAAAELRYPSMDVLIVTLGMVSARARVWVAGAAGAALIVMMMARAIDAGANVCTPEIEEVSGVWNAPARAAVERALDGPERAPARAHVLRALDAQEKAWREMARDACRSTKVVHMQPPEMMDVRMACLHERLSELGAVAQALASGVKGDAEAIDLSDSLSELAPCAAPKTLTELLPPPSGPEVIAEIARVRRELSKVRAEEHAGRYPDAIAHAQSLSEAAAKTGFRPVEAEALLELGRARGRLGDYTGAEHALLDALVAAEAGRHLRAKAETLIALVSISPALRDPQRAREWDRQATAVIEALNGDRVLTAKRDVAASDLALMEARWEDAESRAQEAVSLLESELGREHLDTQQAVRALAQAELRRGQPMKAAALMRQQMELRAQIFGPDNPERWAPVLVLVQALGSAGYFTEALAQAQAARAEIRGKLPDTSNLAVTLDQRTAFALHSLGRQREALALAEQLVERARENPSRPRGLMSALNVRAAVRAMLGRFDESTADYQQQEALLDKVGGDLGNDRGNKAQIEANIGLSQIWSGKAEEGLRRVRAALEQRLKLLRPDHPDLRFMYVDLAEGELLGGHPELALEPARTALELTRAAAGPDSPTTSLAQVQLAEALVGLGRPAEAEPLARKALANWAAHPGLPDHAARAHFVLAKALALSSPAEALAEAEQARQGYAALEGFRKAHAADVEAWVARLRASKRIRGPESR